MNTHIRDIILHDGSLVDCYKRLNNIVPSVIFSDGMGSPTIEGEAIFYEYEEPEYYHFIIEVFTTKISEKPKYMSEIHDMDYHCTTGKRRKNPVSLWRWLLRTITAPLTL